MLFSPTVEDEIAFGPENLCLPQEEIAERVREALRAVGMAEHSLSSPEKLSGGQKQLVAVAALLAMRPKALIFDEVFSPLDREAYIRIKKLISDFIVSGGGVILVEHDEENLSAANRILRMENGRVCEAAHG
jgi:energy-coupling factor transport system ATP-binding protein